MRSHNALYSTVQCIMASTKATLAPRPFPTYCWTLCIPALWIKCSTLLMECLQNHLVSINYGPGVYILVPPAPHMWGRFKCLFASITHLGLSTNLSLIRRYFNWQCPVSNPVIILSWFLIKLSRVPALLAEGLLRKPLVCLCQWTDFQ